MDETHLYRRANFSAALIALVDDGCMLLYSHLRRNARRAARTAFTLLPFMVLLVGSCKTSQVVSLYSGTLEKPEQFRAMLFPDSTLASNDALYHPAAGYLSRAQDYIKSSPESLTMLTEREVSWLFGTPAMLRRDAAARVWQYKPESCVVDFYFYDGAGKAAPVSYVDMRLKGVKGGEIAAEARARCIGEAMNTSSSELGKHPA